MGLDRYAKSVVGALVAAISALGVAWADSVVTPEEWCLVAVAFLTGLGAVWAVPNSEAVNVPPGTVLVNELPPNDPA